MRRTGENLSPDVWESHACPVLDREAAIQVVFASGDLPAIAQRLLPFVDGCAVPSLARIVVRESHTHTQGDTERERERERETLACIAAVHGRVRAVETLQNATIQICAVVKLEALTGPRQRSEHRVRRPRRPVASGGLRVVPNVSRGVEHAVLAAPGGDCGVASA